jgi:TonB family protein
MKQKLFLVILFLIVFIKPARCQKHSRDTVIDGRSGQITDTIINGENKPLIEIMPEFPQGGEPALIKFISSNTKYPEFSREMSIEGIVYTSFIVDSSGRIRDAKVSKSASKELDFEALRVILLMPDWLPGKQNGRNVSVIYNLPFNFKLTGYGKSYKFREKTDKKLNKTGLTFTLGVLYYNKKEFKTALNYFTECITNDIKTTDAYFNRGMCNLKLEDLTEACNDWQKAAHRNYDKAYEMSLKYCNIK